MIARSLTEHCAWNFGFRSSGGVTGNPELQIVRRRNCLLNTIFMSTLHHTIRHDLSTFCARRTDSAKPGECRCKQVVIPTEPEINHKAPQLTTNPEDHLFPQLTGPTNELDFSRLRKPLRRGSTFTFELE